MKSSENALNDSVYRNVSQTPIYNPDLESEMGSLDCPESRS